MICLRCGHCCKNTLVPIVDDLTKGPIEGNIVVHDGQGVACQHLRGEQIGDYSCVAHNEPWYEETPCAQYGQIERDVNTPCRTGSFRKKKIMMRFEKTEGGWSAINVNIDSGKEIHIADIPNGGLALIKIQSDIALPLSVLQLLTAGAAMISNVHSRTISGSGSGMTFELKWNEIQESVTKITDIPQREKQ